MRRRPLHLLLIHLVLLRSCPVCGFISSIAPVACRAPSGSTSALGSTTQGNAKRGTSGPRTQDEKSRTPREIIEDSRDFLQLAAGVVADTGLRTGAIRSTQAARATMSIAVDVTMNVLDGFGKGGDVLETLRSSPPSILRKLCERMGATYIKRVLLLNPGFRMVRDTWSIVSSRCNDYETLRLPSSQQPEGAFLQFSLNRHIECGWNARSVVGQFIASSPTIFPAEYVKEFQKCLDRTDPIPWSVMRPIIEEDLGKRVTEVFSSIDTKPLASASIAQLANPLFASRLSMSDIVGDIRSSMLDELDFTKEASNQEIFGAFLKENNLEDRVTVPRVFSGASSKRVLTMERLYGVPLTDLEGIQKVSENPEATLVAALNTWTLSVMNCEFFHADVHAGNLFVLNDGRVAFIDFGIVGRFSPGTWSGVSRLADGVAAEDFTVMAEGLCEMGATVGPVDTARFASDLENLWVKFNKLDPEAMLASGGGLGALPGGNANVADEKAEQEATGFLLDLVSVSEANGLKLPREFGLLIKQQLYFDRYTKILAPTLDPLRDSRVKMQMKVEQERDMSRQGKSDPFINGSREGGDGA